MRPKITCSSQNFLFFVFFFICGTGASFWQHHWVKHEIVHRMAFPEALWGVSFVEKLWNSRGECDLSSVAVLKISFSHIFFFLCHGSFVLTALLSIARNSAFNGVPWCSVRCLLLKEIWYFSLRVWPQITCSSQNFVFSYYFFYLCHRSLVLTAPLNRAQYSASNGVPWSPVGCLLHGEIS